MSQDKKINFSISLPYIILGLVMICMVLSGCELREQSNLSQNRIQVKAESFREAFDVDVIDAGMAGALASHYDRHGEGPLDLAVLYDPQHLQNGAMKARDEANRISELFRDMGVEHINVNLMPIKGADERMQAVVSYVGYNALAPQDCALMPGMSDFNINANEEYKLGCTMDTLFARQVARPKDLMGQGATYDTYDGRRAANSVEGYRTGVPNESLSGESASGDN